MLQLFCNIISVLIIMPTDQSKMFDSSIFTFKVFGISIERNPSKFVKCYTYIYVFVTYFFFNFLLTLNLYYTPREVEPLISEVVFFFTEISTGSKVITLLFMRKQFMDVIDFVNCDEFTGDYRNKEGLLYKYTVKIYKLCRRVYTTFSNIAFLILVFAPTLHLIQGKKSELPVFKYYFLSDELRDTYFTFLFIYQFFGIYANMMYNVNFDLITGGLFIFVIVQLQLLYDNLSNLKLSKEECLLPTEFQDRIQIDRLNRCLRHYELILEFCDKIQDVLSVTLFVQYVSSTLILSMILCRLIFQSSPGTLIFMMMYFCNMTLEILVTAFLGTELTYKSQQLTTAAYMSEWIPRSEEFKSSLRLFVERAKKPIIFTGLQIFSLSLETFITIMKTAYSMFTLIRNVQDVQE